LFEAGFPTKLDDAKTIDLLEKTALTFFFAPNFHPVIANVMPVRRQLGVKTVFNLLGPLANPLAPEIQLLGVGHKLHMRPVAEALLNLGVQKALVVHSTDGLDEISPAAMTWGLFVENKTINDFPIEPKDFGIRATLTGILGQDATYNLQVLQRILNGERSEASEGVVLNTAVLLWLTDAVGSINDGVTLARQKLNDGSSYKFFKDWIRQANA
jgi:anthranilate phosphoribosyltransferase